MDVTTKSTFRTQASKSVVPTWSTGHSEGILRDIIPDSTGGFARSNSFQANPLQKTAIPVITTSPKYVRSSIPRGVWSAKSTASGPSTDELLQFQSALSINISEFARILRVSRPTVYDWLDGGHPNLDNATRIQVLLRLQSESRVSHRAPLMPQFVRLPRETGRPTLIELLCEKTLNETAIRVELLRAKAMSDEIRTREEEIERRLIKAGFEVPDAEQQKTNIALNLAGMNPPV